MRLTFVFVILISISACHSTNKKVVGHWKMDEVSINGATLPFEQIGKPYYTFDEKGNYILEMNNQIEKGTYRIEEQNIALESSIEKKPKQEYRFELKDSTELLFTSVSAKNKMKVKLTQQKDNIHPSI